MITLSEFSRALTNIRDLIDHITVVGRDSAARVKIAYDGCTTLLEAIQQAQQASQANAPITEQVVVPADPAADLKED